MEIGLFAVRALTSAELAEALAINSDTTSWDDVKDLVTCDVETLVRSKCSPVMKIDSGRIDIAHSSVRDFILSLPPRKLDRNRVPFRFEYRKCHADLAKKSLRYLLLDDIDIPSPAKLSSSRHRFMSYAISALPHHLENAGDHIRQCLPLLDQFLDQRVSLFRQWLAHTTDLENFQSLESAISAVIAAWDIDNILRFGPLPLNRIFKMRSLREVGRFLLRKLDHVFAQTFYHKPRFSFDLEKYNSILTASSNGSIGVISFLIQSCAEIDVRDGSGNTPLHRAALAGKSVAVAMLIAANADVNAVNEYGITPLQLACISGNHDSAALLLACGASITEPDESTWFSPMWLALLHGLEKVAILCFVHGPREVPFGPRMQSPLHCAANQGFTAFLKVALIFGLNPNRVDVALWTPLHYAAEAGDLDAVSILLEAGAVAEPELLPEDPQDPSTKWTPFNLAVDANHASVALSLLDQGADPYKLIKGSTSLHVAVENGNKQLVARDFDPDRCI